MPKKLTTEDFILRSSEVHNNKYDYSLVEYSGNAIPVKIICSEHGVFEQRPLHHLKGSGCPSCGGTEKLTTEVFIQRSIENRGGLSPYDYSKSVYVNNSTKIIVTCPEHGDFLQNPKDHYTNKSNCPLCNNLERKNRNKSSVELFIDKSKDVHNNKYDYSKFEYINSKTKGIIICPEHGEFEQSPNSHLSGEGCLSCGQKNAKKILSKIHLEKRFRNLSQKSFIEKIKKIHGDKISVKGFYNNSLTKVEMNCLFHGSFFATPNNLLYSKSGCPKCSTDYSVSSQETEIYEYIKSIYSGEVIQSYRPEWLDVKELDIYVPEFNFAIEFNGTYWHSEEQKDKWYHFDKTKKCIDNGVILLHIWEFYWNNQIKKDIYLSKIRHYLKMDKVIFARKCKIKEVETSFAVDFIRENHLEGFSIPYKNSKYIGLEHNSEIVMVAIYGEFYSQSKKDFDWKLQRICTLKGYTVVGGISKISKYIKNDVGNFVFQITLDTGGSNLRGISIERNDTSLRYWWIKGNEIKTRNSTQIQLLKKNEDWKEADTELSYMVRNGYIKIYDSGICNLPI